MHTLLNKSETRKFALHVASKVRPFVGFTRVSDHFIERIEEILKTNIYLEIQRLPSKGVTIK